MKKAFAGKSPVLFWILSAIEIAGNIFTYTPVHFFVKPLLVPALVTWIYFSKESSAKKNLLLTGLIFSFAGDVLLLFESKWPLAFIFGLTAFLITHICYIVFFLKHKPVTISFLKKRPLTGLLVIVYGIALIWLLFASLGPLKVPVIIYAVAICSMMLCSLHIFLKVNAPSNLLYILGALLFVLSDSILAVNKFYEPVTAAGVLIMLTYCAAQFFIAKGFINEREYLQ